MKYLERWTYQEEETTEGRITAERGSFTKTFKRGSGSKVIKS